MTISDLYEKQCSVWKEQWENYFGITPFSNWEAASLEEIEEHLKMCCDKFWKSGTNALKDLFANGKCNDWDKLIEDSWEIIYDKTNGLLCLYASFHNDIESLDKDGNNVVERTIKRSPLAYLPYPNDLSMFLSGTEYTLRISANPNYNIIIRTENICKFQRIWTYNIDTDTFEFNNAYKDKDLCPWNNFIKYDKENLLFLSMCLGKEVKNMQDFKEALKSMPQFSYNSILYFNFDHLGEIFKLVEHSKRFANPLSKVAIPINVVKMITSRRGSGFGAANAGKDDSFSNIILTTNKLSALENSRTVLYKSTFNNTFNFDDSVDFFDSFKTSTNKSAGRSRLILDDVYIKDSILYRDGKSMYETILKDKNDEENNKNTKLTNNLSVLSCSSFSTNNDAKRIMMTAKLRPQAIPTVGEIDDFCHETPARVVFGDYKGYNFGDSIIISESFAKKLQSKIQKKIRISNSYYYKELIDPNNSANYLISQNKINPLQLQKLTNSNQYANYRNIEILSLDSEFITIKAIIPFSVGDKITNLHGSKGIVSMILPDDQMPCLKHDLGPNMQAGPFDVIISGLSVYRRKSFGQIFEAWALASDIKDVNTIKDACAKYRKQIDEYSKNSVVEWNGTETIKPCGINLMLRLDHNAVSKQSFSYIKSNYAKMLKFGEMELLNLASRGLYEIINEFDIRSINKYYDSLDQIYTMQKTGAISKNKANNLKFFNILRTIGFDFNLRNDLTCSNSSNIALFSALDENEIEIFDQEKEE